MKKLIAALLGSLLIWSIGFGENATRINNPKGNVTLVEYYDYACPHCRRMEPIIQQLQKEYPALRVVYRATPLLTPQSREIAAFALAAHTQQQGQAVHTALMRLSHAPTSIDLERIIQQLHLNAFLIMNIMQESRIQQQFDKNIHAAETLAVQGVIRLPILVFTSSQNQTQPIILTGEQSAELLAAIVQQLGDPHDAVVSITKQRLQSNTISQHKNG